MEKHDSSLVFFFFFVQGWGEDLWWLEVETGSAASQLMFYEHQLQDERLWEHVMSRHQRKVKQTNKHIKPRLLPSNKHVSPTAGCQTDTGSSEAVL